MRTRQPHHPWAPSWPHCCCRLAGATDEDDGEQAANLGRVVPEDVLEFGLIPELVGRLPIICPLEPQDMESMVRILTEPRNAIVKQYEHMFSLEGAHLEFTRDALELIATRAMSRDTGARALRAVMDELMLELLYALPDRDNKGVTYRMDADSITNRASLDQIAIRAKESA